MQLDLIKSMIMTYIVLKSLSLMSIQAEHQRGVTICNLPALDSPPTASLSVEGLEWLQAVGSAANWYC